MLLSLHLMCTASPEAHGLVSSQALRAFCSSEEGVSTDVIALSWCTCRVGASRARGKGSSELSTARPASPTTLAL